MIVVTGESAGRWVARRDGALVGAVRSLRRPDGLCFLFFGGVRPEAYPPLLEAVMAEVGQPVNAEVDESEEDIFLGLGFTVVRREHRYVLATAVAPVPLPQGYAAISAAGSDVSRLAELDQALREDVPGTAGWRNDPAEFARQTFDDPEFDPETYLVAVDAVGEYAGLVRVWNTTTGPRLGLIAVLPPHRRRGLGYALLHPRLRGPERPRHGRGALRSRPDQHRLQRAHDPPGRPPRRRQPPRRTAKLTTTATWRG